MGVELIREAIDNNIKDELYMLYVNVYPNMNKENYISFDDFYAKSVVKPTSTNMVRDKDEVMNKVERIISTSKVA